MATKFAPLEMLYPELGTASEREQAHGRDCGTIALRAIAQMKLEQTIDSVIFDDPTIVD